MWLGGVGTIAALQYPALDKPERFQAHRERATINVLTFEDSRAWSAGTDGAICCWHVQVPHQ